MCTYIFEVATSAHVGSTVGECRCKAAPYAATVWWHNGVLAWTLRALRAAADCARPLQSAAFQPMNEVHDKLKLLNYETQFCEKRSFAPLTSNFFAMESDNPGFVRALPLALSARLMRRRLAMARAARSLHTSKHWLCG